MKHWIVLFAVAWLVIELSSASAARATSVMGDGTYQYNLIQNGTSTGSSAVTIKRTGSVISIHENETVEDPTVGTVQAVADQTVAASTLSPLSFAAAYTASGKTTDVRLALGTTTGAFIHNGIRLTVPIRMLPGTQAMAIQDQVLVMSFLVIPSQAETANATSFTIANPTGARTFVMQVDPVAPARPANIPASDVAFSVAAPVAFAVWLDARTGVVDEVDVPSKSLVISLTKHS